VIGITASNTWGLFLLVLLLGYGLVAVPRSLWLKSMTSLRLRQIYFKLAKLHGEKCDAEESLEDILNDVKSLAEKIKYNHPSRHCVDIIVKKCPESFRTSLRRNVEDYDDYNQDSARDIPSEKSMVKLHTRLIKALQVTNRFDLAFFLDLKGINTLNETRKKSLVTRQIEPDTKKNLKNFRSKEDFCTRKKNPVLT
jgi:hypothetical protein